LLELGLKTLIAYLLGSLMGAMIIGAMRSVDIRDQGSGNPGATNALRTQGLAFAAGTVLIDVGKGWLAAGMLPQLAIPGLAPDASLDREWLAVCCAAAAVVGHVWPQFYQFRGGKGGATLAGVLLALAPVLAAIATAVWLLVAALSGFAALATMLAAMCVPVAAYLLGAGTEALLVFSLAMAALIIYAHHANIARMENHTEPHLKRLWLLRPRTPDR
jgi:acyl phosphate:glycerol-3-phosphate acyltransferase